MNDLLNRINKLLQWSQLGPAAFADEIGIQRPIMSHILAERNKASLEVIQKILSRFPEVNSEWLLSGKGSLLKESVQETSHVPVDEEPPLKIKKSDKTFTPNPELNNVQNTPFASKLNASLSKSENKVLKKVILLYSDGSFESFDQ